MVHPRLVLTIGLILLPTLVLAQSQNKAKTTPKKQTANNDVPEPKV
jgi:hypothetical protein